MTSKVVVKSYYAIKVKGKSKDTFITDGFNGRKIKLVTSEDKAKKFEYFGLKAMESALEGVMNHIFQLKNRDVANMVIVSKDIQVNLSDIEDKDIYENFVMWEKIIDERTATAMLEISTREDADGEESESYVSIHKFLSHVKELDYKTIIVMGLNWNTFSETKQVNLALHYAGEYNASRFMMFMDYISEKLWKVE